MEIHHEYIASLGCQNVVIHDHPCLTSLEMLESSGYRPKLLHITSCYRLVRLKICQCFQTDLIIRNNDALDHIEYSNEYGLFDSAVICSDNLRSIQNNGTNHTLRASDRLHIDCDVLEELKVSIDKGTKISKFNNPRYVRLIHSNNFFVVFVVLNLLLFLIFQFESIRYDSG